MNTRISVITLKKQCLVLINFTDFQNVSYEENCQNSKLELESLAFSSDTVLQKTCAYIKRD